MNHLSIKKRIVVSALYLEAAQLTKHVFAAFSVNETDVTAHTEEISKNSVYIDGSHEPHTLHYKSVWTGGGYTLIATLSHSMWNRDEMANSNACLILCTSEGHKLIWQMSAYSENDTPLSSDDVKVTYSDDRCNDFHTHCSFLKP